jgi:rubredoxin
MNPGIALSMAWPESPPGAGWTVRVLGRRGLLRRDAWFCLEGPAWAEGNLTAVADALVGAIAAPAPPTARAVPDAAPQGETEGEARHCGDCGGAYDPRYGDPHAAVPPGTPFHALPESWSCPVCGAPGAAFRTA